MSALPRSADDSETRGDATLRSRFSAPTWIPSRRSRSVRPTAPTTCSAPTNDGWWRAPPFTSDGRRLWQQGREHHGKSCRTWREADKYTEGGTYMARAISAVAAQLQRSLSPGQVLCDRADEHSRHRGSDATDDRVIVFPETPHDVQIAVLAARERNLPLSVRAGGASAGLPTCDPRLVIDLSRKQRVVVDPEHRTATIQGGATAGGVASTARGSGFPQSPAQPRRSAWPA